jgi:hypothetical protein
VPKHIKVDGLNYIFDEFEMFYHRDNDLKADLLVLGKDYSTWDFLNWNVELIKEQTIDIDSIEEIKLSEYDREHYVAPIRSNADKINELIKAVKHLNKEIQSIKEK